MCGRAERRRAVDIWHIVTVCGVQWPGMSRRMPHVIRKGLALASNVGGKQRVASARDDGEAWGIMEGESYEEEDT